MIYQMNLAKEPFELIKSGHKVVEMRLCKPEREQIRSGDTIVFHSNDGQTLSVLVLNIAKYPSFEELYNHYDKKKLGYRDEENANPNDMLIYYKKEEIEKLGVLAIEIQLL